MGPTRILRSTPECNVMFPRESRREGRSMGLAPGPEVVDVPDPDAFLFPSPPARSLNSIVPTSSLFVASIFGHLYHRDRFPTRIPSDERTRSISLIAFLFVCIAFLGVGFPCRIRDHCASLHSRSCDSHLLILTLFVKPPQKFLKFPNSNVEG